MRVCDLTHAYTPTSGGIRTYINAKRRHLVENTDWEHVLVIPAEHDAVEREGRLTTVRIAGPVIPGAAPYRFFARPAKLRAALAEVQPDLIELGTYYMPPEARAAFAHREAARTSGRPAAVAVQFHTDFARAYAGHYGQRLLGARLGGVAERVARRYVRRILTRADLLLAVSQEHAETLEALTGRPVVHTPLGVNLGLFHPERHSDAARARLGIEEDEAFLVYAGRLDAEKDVSVLADALERLPERFRLVIVGEGPHREALEARAEALGGRLIVLPYLREKKALAELLASADVYVTAGPHETFGLSVAEAQAAGLPVVGVRAGALVDRVPEHTGLLGPTGDAEAMAAKIERVFAKRRRMGHAARAHVEATLSWSATFARVFAAYEAAMAAR